MKVPIPTDVSSAASANVLEPDAHGQAALMLVESVLHKLVEMSVFSTAQAVEAVQSAAEIKVEAAVEAGESSGRMIASLVLLDKIRASLASDVGAPHASVLDWTRES